ncbi:hypothetical protein ACU5DF_18525 [Aliivibrio wodanis]|uniref:hypothetical protein n=1 Tax=Aliivibrio wodanis TaxID=80852 RepID=UPI00406CA8CA
MNLSRFISIRQQFLLLMVILTIGIITIISINTQVHNTNNQHLSSLEEQYYPAIGDHRSAQWDLAPTDPAV